MILKQIGISKTRCCKYYWGEPEQAPHWRESVTDHVMRTKIKNSTLQVHDHSLPRWHTCSYVFLCKMDSERCTQERLSPIEGNYTAREKHEERVARLTRQHVQKKGQ